MVVGDSGTHSIPSCARRKGVIVAVATTTAAAVG